MKRKKCISCKILILKSAKSNPFLCRDCESEFKKMDLAVPIYYGENKFKISI